MWAFLLASFFTLVELNCENLFDFSDNPQKNDEEFLPASGKHWTPRRYWCKLNHIGQEILSCGTSNDTTLLPDLVALCEVESDSVCYDLTRRSLLRKAGYSYIVTHSPDERGVNVALLYQPFRFSLIHSYPLRITPLPQMRRTRDILYASFFTASGDTLHVFVVHAPSRFGGERASRPNRLLVARRLAEAVDSVRALSPRSAIVVTGDFNDGARDSSLVSLYQHHLHNVTDGAMGSHGASGTYRYQGEWESIDHVLASDRLLFRHVFIHDAPFLLEPDTKYGGVKPFRTYLGYRYQSGFSDHLPLVVQFSYK